MNKLPDFLKKKYIEWQCTLGHKKTLEEYAEYLKVNRPLLSFWMSGRRIPNTDNLENIALILGDEVFDTLGLPRPNPNLQKIKRLWKFIPEDVQIKLTKEAEKYEV